MTDRTLHEKREYLVSDVENANLSILPVQVQIILQTPYASDYIRINQFIKDVINYCHFSSNSITKVRIKNCSIRLSGTIEGSLIKDLFDQRINDLNSLFKFKNNSAVEPILFRVEIKEDRIQELKRPMFNTENTIDVVVHDEIVIMKGNLFNRYSSKGIT
ncbi:hypothetical protein SAMN06296008_101307 [Polynucleobacter kasalickyi]|uniref:Uncharacterized protein n=2 Tax=Polynucleobacter kasalickyi TaxID=1938817 RepID=A0A1W1Y546_9BURK|nr:hypothetical protein SAMN06296008_101307 [Polynucleobacter kasalickyi]